MLVCLNHNSRQISCKNHQKDSFISMQILIFRILKYISFLSFEESRNRMRERGFPFVLGIFTHLFCDFLKKFEIKPKKRSKKH